MLLRNIAVIEQICCSPSGSVRGYRSGIVLHEPNGLTAEQHSLAHDVQAGVLAYVAAAREQASTLKISPFADVRTAANAAAATLGRLLLLPTDEELLLLGPLQHDVNLGTVALTPLIDGELLAAQQVTRSLPDACTTAGPSMWLAGSLAALSPAQSFLYLLFGANVLPSDIFGDVKCGRIELILEDHKGVSNAVQAACYRTGFGDIRMRIPMSRAMAIRAITVPIARLATEGVVSGPFLQSGDTVDQVARSTDILKLDGPGIRHRGMTWNAGHYSATHDDAALTIDLPLQTAAVTILSIGLTPLNGGRVLAVD
jgi:hypothetical protein